MKGPEMKGPKIKGPKIKGDECLDADDYGRLLRLAAKRYSHFDQCSLFAGDSQVIRD
jgi:hypothetical protein